MSGAFMKPRPICGGSDHDATQRPHDEANAKARLDEEQLTMGAEGRKEQLANQQR